MNVDVGTYSLSGSDIDYTEDLVPFEIEAEDMISAIQALSEEIEAVTAQLTGLPNDLYEFEKATLFDPNHNFITIDDLDVPEGFTLHTALSVTDQHYDDFERLAIDVVEQPHNYELEEDFSGISVLSELSGNKVVDSIENKRAYFEHLELIKSIQLSAINESNAYDIIAKIAYSTTKMLDRRNLAFR